MLTKTEITINITNMIQSSTLLILNNIKTINTSLCFTNHKGIKRAVILNLGVVDF